VVPQQLSRVFLNIVNNACYAVHKRKDKAGADYQPTLTLRTRRTSEWVEIRIRDNGTGMPKEVAAKIFDPFFTTKPAGVGTGLGLSISYDIIAQGHQGELSVESVAGEYTEFTIKLPVKAAA
jgi:signal transduction histidine kinase